MWMFPYKLRQLKVETTCNTALFALMFDFHFEDFGKYLIFVILLRIINLYIKGLELKLHNEMNVSFVSYIMGH